MKIKLLGCVMTGLLAAMSASATTVVDYTEMSAATTAAPLRAPDSGNVTNASATWNFSDSIYLVDYTPAGNTNTSWYGGMTKSTTRTGGFGALLNNQERFQGNNFRLRYTTSGTAAPDPNPFALSLAGAFIWNKADFINNSTDQLQLGTGDSMSLTLSSLQAAGGTATARMVVEQGGVYYASFSSISSAATLTISDFAAETWGLLNTTDYSVGSFSSLTLDDIQAVGYTFNLSTANMTTTNTLTQATLSDFVVNASVVVVPEPSAFALGGLGLAALLILRRRY